MFSAPYIETVYEEYEEVDGMSLGSSLGKSSENIRIRRNFPESWIFELDSGYTSFSSYKGFI